MAVFGEDPLGETPYGDPLAASAVVAVGDHGEFLHPPVEAGHAAMTIALAPRAGAAAPLEE